MPKSAKNSNDSKKRKYLPMTSKKRFKSKNKDIAKARARLAWDSKYVFDRADKYFHNMSNQSSGFWKISVEEATPGQIFQRITASRVYYAFDNSIVYQRFRKVDFRAESADAEKLVLNLFRDRGWTVMTEVQLFHPILFFISCVPDGLCEHEGKQIILEIKAIFKEDSSVYNEMGELYVENLDKLKWIRQVQFSLHCAGLEEGLLVLFDYSKQTIIEKILVTREPQFFEINFDKFRNFFIDIVFYDNSCLRRVKPNIRSLVKKRITALFDCQIQLNSSDLKVRNMSTLDSHFKNQFTRFLNSELKHARPKVALHEEGSQNLKQNSILSEDLIVGNQDSADDEGDN